MSASGESKPARLYCLPLVSRAGVFVVPEEWSKAGIEFASADEMRGYLARHHQVTRGVICTPSGTYHADVHVPKVADDYCYSLVTENLVPPEHVPCEPFLDADVVGYLDNLRRRLATSEALLPEQTCYLWTEFVHPKLVLRDTRRSAPRLLGTWKELANVNRVLIVGAPGAGKTTLLRRMALDLADVHAHPQIQFLPVYVQLRQLVRGDTVERVTKRELAETGAPGAASNFTELAASGRFVFLLDGFDEIPSGWRAGVADNIRAIVQRFDTCRYLIATRPAAISPMFQEFEKCELTPFTHVQMKELCWHKLEGEPRPWSSFWVRLAAERELMDVSSNPFALSLLVARFKRNEVSPHSVNEAVRLIAEAAVDEWDSTRGIRRSSDSSLTPAQKLGLLRRLASYLAIEGRRDFSVAEFKTIAERVLTDEHTAPATLNTLEEHTGLVRCAGDERWQFSHQAVLDFMASSFVDRPEVVIAKINENPGGDKWHQVLRHACGQASDPGNLVTQILEQIASREDGAILLAKVMSQDLVLDRLVAERCVSYVLTALEDLLLGADLKMVYGPEVGDACVYAADVRFSADIAPSRAARLVSLLKWTYAARDGSVSVALRERCRASAEPAVREIAELYDVDGLIETDFVCTADGTTLRVRVLKPSADAR